MGFNPNRVYKKRASDYLLVAITTGIILQLLLGN